MVMGALVGERAGRDGEERQWAQEGQLYLLRGGEIQAVWQREWPMQKRGGRMELNFTEEERGGQGGWREWGR